MVQKKKRPGFAWPDQKYFGCVKYLGLIGAEVKTNAIVIKSYPGEILSTQKHSGGNMARINIESSLFTDNRFFELAFKLGSKTMAIGALVEAYILAQKYFLNESSDRYIPLSEWKRQLARNEIIDVGLAEIRDGDKVYVAGAEKAFAWLIQRKNAGSLGGKKKASNRNKAKESLATASDRLAEPSGLYPPIPIPIPIPILSPSPVPTGLPHATRNSELNREVWNAYATSYIERYGIKPLRNPTVNSQISNLATRIGADAVELVKFYLQHNKKYYLEKSHSIGICLKDAESIYSEWKRGVQITNSSLNQFEKMNATNDLLKQIDVCGV